MHRSSLAGLFAAAVVAALAFAPSAALAGAGANVKVCVNLKNPPIMPFIIIRVMPGGTTNGHSTHCMNNAGNAANIMVNGAGVHCADMGYVEAKASSSGGDLCATDTSYWTVSYQEIDPSPVQYRGTAASVWQTGDTNLVTWNDYSGNAASFRLCDSADPNCKHLPTDYDSHGNPVYVNSEDWLAGTVGTLYFFLNY